MSTVDPQVYKESISNILSAVEKRLSPKILERLKKDAGIEPAALKPAYPLKTQDAMIKVLAEELYPGKHPDVATYELGTTLMARYSENVLGRAMFSVIRLLGPMRVLKRVPDFFKQGNIYVNVSLNVTGPSSYELDHNEVGRWPHFTRGSMASSGTVIGLKDHAVELLSYDGHRAKYRVSWQ